MSLVDRIRSASNNPAAAGEALVELVLEMVRIPSLTGDERGLAIYLADLLKQLGWEVGDPDEHHNVVARARGSRNGPSIVLLSHTDTAKPGAMVDPYEPRVEEGQSFGKEGMVIRGRGATSPKGTLAAMIMAIERIRTVETVDADVILAAVSRDLLANNDGIRDIHAQGVSADYMISGEPTNNQVVTRARGIAQFDVTFSGVPAHAGTPDLAVNPILLAARFLNEVATLPLPADEQLGSATLAVLSIEGIGNPPATPETCRVVLDYRPLPGDDPRAMMEKLEELGRRCCGSTAGAECAVRLLRSMHSFAIPEETPIVQIALDSVQQITGERTDVGQISFATNGGYALVEMGIPTICYGPGSIGDTGANEHIEIKSLREAVDVYEAMIRHLASRTATRVRANERSRKDA